jgi:hypothetical protein
VPHRSKHRPRGNLPRPLRGEPGRERIVRPTSGIRRAIIWAWLAVYLAAYWLWPISGSMGQPLRRVHFWLSLVLGDDTLARWVEGCSWISLAQRGQILAIAAGILLVAVAAGWMCIRLSRIEALLTRLECGVFSAAVGLNLVSLITLALGLAGLLWWNLFVILGALLACAAAALYLLGLRGRQANAFAELSAGEDSGELRLSDRWLWLAVPFVVAILASAMLPPFDFDVREYHLQAPKEFYEAGRIEFLPHNVYANMPLGAEILSLAAMVVARDWWMGALVGKTLIAAFAPLTALGLLAAGRRFITPSAGVLAAIFYVSIPWIALVSSQGLVEGVFGFYLFMAAYAVWMWAGVGVKPARGIARPSGEATRFALLSKAEVAPSKAEVTRDNAQVTPSKADVARDVRLLALAGFLSGAAVATKYPAVVFSALPLAAYVLYRSLASARRSKSRPPGAFGIAKPVGVFCLACAVGCGPWLAKNAVLTGNPVYPLLSRVFDGATRTPEKEAQWSRAHRPPNFQPADLVARTVGFAIGSDWLSPLVAPLAVLAFLSRGRRQLAWALAGYLVYALVTWWLFTHRIDRFWVPMLPIAALLAGIGAVWSSETWWRATLAFVTALGLLFNFSVIAGGQLADNRYLADLDALRVDPDRVEPWHLYLNEHAGEITGVLLVGDAQPFDLNVPTIYNTVFDDNIFDDLVQGRPERELSLELTRRGISHIYVSWREIERYRSRGNYGITPFIQPEVFKRLVKAGVLEELPPLPDDSGQLFRVLPPP